MWRLEMLKIRFEKRNRMNLEFKVDANKTAFIWGLLFILVFLPLNSTLKRGIKEPYQGQRLKLYAQFINL